jgi:hypothetical protein
MEKKKKKPALPRHRLLAGCLIGIVSIVGCCFLILLAVHMAWHPCPFCSVSQMEYWELPPNSELVTFEEYSQGGTNQWWVGELTILTTLAEEEVKIFYRSRYQPDCVINADLTFSLEGYTDDGRMIYRIRSCFRYDIF